MLSVQAVRYFLSRHRWTADCILAALVSAVSLLPFLGGPISDERGFVLTPALLVNLFCACAILTFRRSTPWGVWFATTFLGLAAVSVSHGPTPLYAPAIVALYTVSVRTGVGPASFYATAASALTPVVFILESGHHDVVDSIAFGMTPWSVLSTMTALAIRSQRAVVASANERAREAEATREDEAQRRVTEERLRIARELHDVVAHHISAITVQAGVAAFLIHRDPYGASEAVAQVRRSSKSVLRELPTLLGLLRTDTEQMEMSPVPAFSDVDDLVHQARLAGQRIVLRTSGRARALLPASGLAAYRVVQEALTNARKYGTGRIVMHVDYAPSGLSMYIQNYVAFRSDTNPAAHHGLIGMHERIKSIGGTLTVGPVIPDKWVVQAWIPIEHSHISTKE